MSNKTSITFQHQRNIPKLPIPSLVDTCTNYLKCIEPLETEAEFRKTKVAVDQFLNSEGLRLQEKLLAYDATHSSYIEDFWYEAYLNHRSSVVLNVNPFFVLEDDPTPSKTNQISRAASLILSSIQFINALRKKTLAPDIWRNGIPLCMNQYKHLFGCTRIPTAMKDTIKSHPTSKHIVIIVRNQFYWFDVIWEDGTAAITERELISNLKSVHKNAAEVGESCAANAAVGVLTTEHRVIWAKLREGLWTNNKECLDIIDTALFLVCLDGTCPSDAALIASTALHGTYEIANDVQIGTCMNRWYDKLQIIVCENGVAGINFEHSFVDGHTVLRFVSNIFTDTIIRFAQSIQKGNFGSQETNYRSPHTSNESNPPNIKPEKITWILTDEFISGIKSAEAKLSDLILQNEVQVLEFANYGKVWITQHNMSPDAFMQIAFLSAYYAQYGDIPNTYEPVLTKRFLHGRTEAARAVTRDSIAFVSEFDGKKTDIEKAASLKKAIDTHVGIVRQSASVGGMERHLFALECLWEAEMVDKSRKPAIFADIGWKKLNHTILSTSNCGNPCLRLFGFGPVESDGFGIGYIIKDEGIQICASSKHRQTKRYLKNLELYLVKVQSLFVDD